MGELTQQLIVAQEPSLDPSTHAGHLTTACNSRSRVLITSGLLRCLNSHPYTSTETQKHNFKIANTTNIWILKMNDTILVNFAWLQRDVWGSQLRKKGDLFRVTLECVWSKRVVMSKEGGAELRSFTALSRKVLMTPTRSTYQRDAPVTRRPRLGLYPKILRYSIIHVFHYNGSEEILHPQPSHSKFNNQHVLFLFFFTCAQQ